MLRSMSDLKRFTIKAADGILGSVRDLCFDSRGWIVRYVVVDAGERPSRRVLVSAPSLDSSPPEPTTLRLGLTRNQIGNDLASADVGQQQLQTVTALLGYSIQSEDGEIGHVEDVLVDDRAWAIRYLVVNTEKWWDGKKVLISPEWLTRVTGDESKTLFSIVTAVGDGIDGGRPTVPAGRPNASARVRAAAAAAFPRAAEECPAEAD
jgi:sporulation protein YlmC with PRC-barrel domain